MGQWRLARNCVERGWKAWRHRWRVTSANRDFCTSQLAGWHATIFPLYFVVGAVYCGFGMVLVLLIPLRKLCHLEEIITPRHMDRICKLTLLSSVAIAYIYLMEYFNAWYSGDPNQW